MEKENSEDFQSEMSVYYSKCFLVKDLYWKRINTSIKLAKLQNENIILDIGCNKGQLLKAIKKLNHKCECWGTDIESGITSLKIDDCKFRVADVKSLPFDDNYFDVIFALSTLEHVKDIDESIKEIHRVLKNDGIFVLSSPTESRFYRFCRLLLFGVSKKNVYKDKPGFKGESDFHYRNVYEIEKKCKEIGFIQLNQEGLPGFPIPTLHRITKFQKKS